MQFSIEAKKTRWKLKNENVQKLYPNIYKKSTVTVFTFTHTQTDKETLILLLFINECVILNTKFHCFCVLCPTTTAEENRNLKYNSCVLYGIALYFYISRSIYNSHKGPARLISHTTEKRKKTQ